MKGTIPILAALLLLASGCGLDQPKHTAAEEEPRHPSNEMNRLPKEEPKRHEPSKLVAAKRALAKPPRRAPAFEDPKQIPAGIEYGEMLRRFGPPTMGINDGPGRITYAYSKVKTQVQVEVENGKVISVGAIETGF